MESHIGKRPGFAGKVAALAGIGVAAIAPEGASSAIAVPGGAPMQITAFARNAIASELPHDYLPWDIDGHSLGTFDFAITRSTSFCARDYCAEIDYARVAFYGYGAEFIAESGKLQPLPESYSVGPAPSNYAWGLGQLPILSIQRQKRVEFYVTYPGGDRVAKPPQYFTSSNIDSAFSDLQSSGNFVGFRFFNFYETGTPHHYGFADFDLTDGMLEITSVAYDDVPETPTHVQEIAAPPAGIASLTLLGMGAAGLRRWRKRPVA